MFNDDTRQKLKNIVSGIIIEGQADHCTAARNILCTSFRTSTTVKKDFESQSIIKEEQVGFLKRYCTENNLWVHNVPGDDRFLTRGGEAKVYLDSDHRSVIKLNDAIYYATWLEFFNSLVIHNLLFTATAYTFLGFTERDNSFQAVLKQPFISSDGPVDLSDVKKLLAYDGFENTKRNDYFNKELGLILEDIHDENVIVNSEMLFFIDTVFYTVSGN